MRSVPWFLNGYFLKRHMEQKCKIYTSETLNGARILQQKYPSDLIALPAHVFWYEVDDAKYLDYSRLCATNIYSMPYRSLEVIWNTPVKCMLSADMLYKFEDKEIVSYNAIVLNNV